MHDWDKGETPGPSNGEMMRQAMWAMGPEVSLAIFNEELPKIRAKCEEVERQRRAAERERKLAQLRETQQRVADLQRELGVYACHVCGELVDNGNTCHGPPPP